MKRFLSLLFVLVVLSLQANAQCGVHCGTERWKVKTLTDTTAGNIDPTETARSITQLRNLTRPSNGNLPDETRVAATELKTFRITGRVIRFKREDDKDIHVVLAQTNSLDNTIVVEFANPVCADVCSSPELERIRQARQDFINKFGNPTTKFKTPAKVTKIQVVGVGFFDRLHGQSGMAPNGIEIHPVLSMRVVN
jgi:hypothetical protein